jgi:hypothetical protein
MIIKGALEIASILHGIPIMDRTILSSTPYVLLSSVQIISLNLCKPLQELPGMM